MPLFLHFSRSPGSLGVRRLTKQTYSNKIPLYFQQVMYVWGNPPNLNFMVCNLLLKLLGTWCLGRVT
jgi:hypothetical protein